MQRLHFHPRTAASGGVRETPGFRALWELEPLAWITRARTSDVCVVRLPFRAVGKEEPLAFRKRYWYPRRRDRWKGFFRNTFFRSSRAAAEFRNLDRLQEAGLSLVRPLAFGEERRFRFLRRALLLTEAVPGTETLEDFLQGDGAGDGRAWERTLYLCALGRWVGRLHFSGYRDRDLFARNILVHPEGTFPRFSKIDAPKGTGRVLAPGYGKPFPRDLADLDRDLERVLSRADRLRCLLAYLGADRADREVRGLLARILRVKASGT